MAANSLVAASVDMSTPFSGTFLLEDGEALVQAIQSGDWVSGGLAAFSAIADTVAAVMDPLGSLIAAGLGWIMEHLEPLKGWLNDLTGDAGEVAGFAATWANIGASLAASGDNLVSVLGDLDASEGDAIDAYRRFQQETAEHLRAAGGWAEAIGVGMNIAATIVKIVHDLTRDAIAQIVGSVISYAATLVITLGTATPLIISQATSRVSSLSARIGKTVTRLLESAKQLTKLIDQLATLFKRFDAAAGRMLPGGKSPDLPTRGAPALPPGRPNPPALDAPPRPGGSSPYDLPRSSQSPMSDAELADIRSGGYSMAWFDGTSKASYYDVQSPALGGSGRPFFVMPAEDGAIIRNASDAARYTGMSPATERAMLNDGDIYSMVFPKDNIPHHAPTAADARGWPHFLEGGHTAVRTEGPGGGYLVNPTREQVIAGGTAVPSGSSLVRLGRDGELIIVRRFP